MYASWEMSGLFSETLTFLNKAVSGLFVFATADAQTRDEKAHRLNNSIAHTGQESLRIVLHINVRS